MVLIGPIEVSVCHACHSFTICDNCIEPLGKRFYTSWSHEIFRCEELGNASGR